MESSSTNGGVAHQYFANIAPPGVSGGYVVVPIIILILLWLGIWLLAASKALRQMDWEPSKGRDRALVSMELAGTFSLALALVFRYYYFPLLFGASIFSFLGEVFIFMFLYMLVDRVIFLGITHKGNTPPAWLLWVAGALSRLFGPVAHLPVLIADTIHKKIFGHNRNFEISDEGSEVAGHSIMAEGQEEQNLERSHISFGERQVKQIMKPRVDVVGVEENLGYHDMMKEVRNAGYSRIPVYREDLDNVAGILYVKDLLAFLDKDDDFKWQTLVRKPLFVPETMKIDNLLREMKKTRVHIALTVDEYGMTSGLVTLEDIMEEVMGEIRDEYDDSKELQFEKVGDHSYIFEGKMLLGDMCKVLGLESDTFDDVKGDTDSVAGLVLQLEGRLPQAGEEISYREFLFRVEAMGMNRIEKVRVTINEEALKEQDSV